MIGLGGIGLRSSIKFLEEDLFVALGATQAAAFRLHAGFGLHLCNHKCAE
jgi:hypothetical protein